MKSALLALGLLAFGQPEAERIVFLGDSITDGNTLPLLVRQALGSRAPACINAGVAGDTAAGMKKRLERDVLSRRPTLVALSVGINDVLRKVAPADYEADVLAISDRLKRDGIPLLLLTPTPLGPKHQEAEPRLAEYIEILRRLAARQAYAVAEVRSLMNGGQGLLEPDQVHLTFEGYRVMARAVLDALGHKGIAVPAELNLAPMPGVVREWKIRALPDGEMKTLTLPQSGKTAHWWFDQERARGFAVELDKALGPGKRFGASATMESKEPRDVYFNTGAELGSLSLNGKPLWKNEGWTGWHAGKERIAARLAAGTNTIEIEAGTSFFLSVTDENGW
jgi:lysophospholipase L1-like esterase